MALLEAGIVGRDAEVMERFYTEVMGFSVAHRLQFDAFGTVVRLHRPGARMALVTDPEGNPWELIHSPAPDPPA